ncbi:VCBS domain-containing protein, partial [Amphibiibacter pelophylacis]
GAAVAFDAATKDGTYGKLALAADGKWTYTLNNDAANVQALITGQTVKDTFTVTSKDGQTTTVTVNVAGL